jgi:hypothetical protein
MQETMNALLWREVEALLEELAQEHEEHPETERFEEGE